jgi:hypothetical protein
VSEYHCVDNPQTTTYNGSTYYVGQMTAYCAYGCASGKCLPGPSGSTTRESEPMEEMEFDDNPETPDVIDIEVKFNEPIAPTRPSCDNTDNAGFLCGMCLSSFCPFGSDRANSLCSFYCSADASLSLTADLTNPGFVPSSVPSQSQNNKLSLFLLVLAFFFGWF